MKSKLILTLGAVSFILSLLLVAPVLGQSDEELGKQLKEYKEQTFKDLQLNAQTEKKLTALEDKSSIDRGKILDESKKAWDNLQAALAEAKPDEAKVKKAVRGYLAVQTRLFKSFRQQLEEELAQMTPVQQGKFLVAMEHWREKCMPKVCTPTSK